jgi:hypothetical protein
MFSKALTPAAFRMTGATLVAAATMLSFPGAAHAARDTHRDAIRDVVSVPDRRPEADPKVHPREDRGDVTRLVVEHRRGELHIKLKLRDVTRPVLSGMIAEIASPRNRLTAAVYKDPDTKKMVIYVFDEQSGEPRCGGATWRYSGKRNVVSMTLPTRCLGNSRWVRVGAAYSWFKAGRLFVDDAQRDSGIAENRLTLGPKVRRG